MKVLKINIDRCFQCPYLIEDRGNFCKKLEKPIDGIAVRIPKECPLPDKKGKPKGYLTGKGLTDCPMCLFSSGMKPFVKGSKSQKCDSCNGSGRISKTKYNSLLDEFGDLIK